MKDSIKTYIECAFTWMSGWPSPNKELGPLYWDENPSTELEHLDRLPMCSILGIRVQRITDKTLDLVREMADGYDDLFADEGEGIEHITQLALRAIFRLTYDMYVE
jgi:hypothetical protein